MKQPSKKVSHYDTGQPWDKPKIPSPKAIAKEVKKLAAKTVQLHPYQEDAFESIYSKFYGLPPWLKDKKEKDDGPEIVIYKARKLAPKEFLVDTSEVKMIEGMEVVITQHKVLKKNEYMYFYRYFADSRPTIRDQVKDFLEKPKPKFESPLILSDEFVRVRQVEAELDAITEFIEQTITEQVSPYKRQATTLYADLERRASQIGHQKDIITQQRMEIMTLQARIVELENRQLTLMSRTITIGTNRHFRVEG